MNSGIFGEGFPYSNFHDMNLDWMIKIAKDFLDQYTNIQDIISQGLTDIGDKIDGGLDGLDSKYEALVSALDDWYNEHSEDIAGELSDALEDLNSWYTTHEGYLDQYVTDSIAAFNTAASNKAAETIASIPDDYTDVANYVGILKTALDTCKIKGGDNITYADGYYAANGSVVSTTGTGFKRSSRIVLASQATIFLWTSGYQTNVCMIGQEISGSNNVTPLVVCDDSNLKLYKYTNTGTTAIAIRISYKINDGNYFFILPSFEDYNWYMNRVQYGVGYFGNATQAGTYDDLNNLPTGSIATYGYTGMTHAPAEDFAGTVYTASGRKNGAGDFTGQLAISSGGAFYFRGRYANYTAWSKIDPAIAQYLCGLQVTSSSVDVSSNKADGYFTATGQLVTGTSGGGFYTPTPIQVYKGDIIRLKAQGYLTNMALLVEYSSAGRAPLIISVNNKYEYYYMATMDMTVQACSLRDYESNFSITRMNSQAITSIMNSIPGNVEYNISTFKKYGVCGDSLSSGCVVHNEGGSPAYTDMYHFSWIQYIARKTGNTAVNFSKSGLTTRSWLTDTNGLAKLQNADNKCDCYFIALGVNDANSLGSDYLGDISDVNTSNPVLSADTFYGNYAKIIGYIRQVQPKAIIFCIKMPNATNDATISSFNNAIGSVAETLDTEVITLTNSDYSDTLGNRRWGHYNAWGYNQWAEIIMTHVNEYMNSHPDTFLQIEFIGTNYSWTG